MNKSPDAFRTISEVADWLGLQAHVLRFWESKFAQVKPVKRAGGRRYYRPADMQLLGGIKKLLHDDGLTIKGVQKIIREQGVAHVATFSQPLDSALPAAGETNVVPLKSSNGAPPLPPMHDLLPDDDGDAEEIAPQAKPAPQTSDHPPEPEAATAPQAEPTPEPETGPAPLPDPEPEPTAARAQEPDTEEPETAETPMPDTAAPIRKPAAAPDPGTARGALSQLARIRALDPEQAREIAPLAQALRQWHDRARAGGAV